MSGLHDIPVTVVPKVTEQVTANVQAILTEITSMLAALIEQDKSDAIDLRSLPLLPGELEAIKVILGEGEISLSFDSLGPTKIYETALGGVWWIHHLDENGNTISELIEITRVPDIIKSQPVDIAAAHAALSEQITEWID